MNKKFLFAALAAVALTLGFTACDDDDVDAGKYEMTVNVHVDVMGSDYNEFETIFNAYHTAFGLGKLDEDAESESTTITGKDSVACVKSIQELCAQVEKQLDGQTWADDNIISIRDTVTNAAIYTKTYGPTAENGESITYSNFDMADFDYPWKRYYIPSEDAVTHVYVDSRSNMISPFTLFWQTNYVGKDLNQGAGGNYVYPSYANTKFVRDPNATWYIGGLLVLVNESGNNPPQSFWFEDCRYEIAVDSNTRLYAFDLNHKAGGPYLYLYYTRSYYTKKALIGSKSGIWSANVNLAGRKDNLVRGVTYKSDESITLTHPKGIDLNEGAGGDYMYWKEIYEKLEEEE